MNTKMEKSASSLYDLFVEKALFVQNLDSLGSTRFSDDQIRDKLVIHFQSQKISHGGDVKEVIYPLTSAKGCAIVVFEDEKDLKSVVKHQQIFYGQLLEVYSMPPMNTKLEKSAISPYDVVGKSLFVQNLDSFGSTRFSDDQIRDKLLIHFQNRRLSHGGDVKEVIYPLTAAKGCAIVVFEDEKDLKSVVKHEQKLYDQLLQVDVLPPIFSTVRAELHPLYLKIMPPNIYKEISKTFQAVAGVTVDGSNCGKIACSLPSRLDCIGEEVVRLVMCPGKVGQSLSSITGEFEAAVAYADVETDMAFQRGQAKASDKCNECPICLGAMVERQVLPKCKHAFCKSCIKQILETNGNRCPVCRMPCGADQVKASDNIPDECPICLGVMVDVQVLPKCKHAFCKSCIKKSFVTNGNRCPLCRMPCGADQVKASDNIPDECPICLGVMVDVQVLPKCKHAFCKSCIKKSFEITGNRCPVCRMLCGEPKGNQPDGTMKYMTSSYLHLPGYPHCGIITINYDIPSGMQSANHPNPRQRFLGASRTAYLPDNAEGREVLALLKKAFNARLVFTVGLSVTSGTDNVVTWNDIHHKTSQTGGPQNFGYPDPGYLRRVKQDLAAKGIV